MSYGMLRNMLVRRARLLGLSEDFIETIRTTDDYEELRACVVFLDDLAEIPTVVPYIYNEWEL